MYFYNFVGTFWRNKSIGVEKQMTVAVVFSHYLGHLVRSFALRSWVWSLNCQFKDSCGIALNPCASLRMTMKTRRLSTANIQLVVGYKSNVYDAARK